MPRAIQPVEQNSFVSGLITEASPLTFPQNASLDEQNFVLYRDGHRERRLGFDLEDDHVVVDSGEQVGDGGSIVSSSFRWTNVGGDGQTTFIVVQIQNSLFFFDSSIRPLSAAQVASNTYTNLPSLVKFSYTVVDGMLVVVTGGKDVDVYTWDGSVMSILSKRLFIRDLFGVTDISAGD